MIAKSELLGLSPAAKSYAAGIAALHELELAGKFESDEAEAVRDAMDAPWHYMNSRERTITGQLAASINGLLESVTGPDSMEESEYRRILESLQSKVGVAGLTVVDEFESQLPVSIAAFLRGLCWVDEGVPEIAVCYFRNAFEQDPSASAYLFYLVRALLQLERFKEASEIAIANESLALRPEVRIKLAEAILAQAMVLDDTSANPLFLRANDNLERSLVAVTQSQQIDPEVIAAGYVLLGICRIGLGDEGKAKSACEMALQVDPTNVDALALWAQFNFRAPSSNDRKAFLRNRIATVLSATYEAPKFVSYVN